VNHQEYLIYRKTLSVELLFLDDLIPYDLLEPISETFEPQSKLVTRQGEYIKTSMGIRRLLKDIFLQFKQDGYKFVIPSDIYPVYESLVPDDGEIYHYNTFSRTSYELPDISKSVLLIANPLVPQGRYLSGDNMQDLATWLATDMHRWLIFDNVYDFKEMSNNNTIKSDNIIYLNSLTKSTLTPDKFGWAMCKRSCLDFSLSQNDITQSIYSSRLQTFFIKAWNKFRLEREDINQLWSIPDVGYMTTIHAHYNKLHKLGIAALPATIFGIQDPNVSVMSCLVEVKRDLLAKNDAFG